MPLPNLAQCSDDELEQLATLLKLEKIKRHLMSLKPKELEHLNVESVKYVPLREYQHRLQIKFEGIEAFTVTDYEDTILKHAGTTVLEVRYVTFNKTDISYTLSPSQYCEEEGHANVDQIGDLSEILQHLDPENKCKIKVILMWLFAAINDGEKVGDEDISEWLSEEINSFRPLEEFDADEQIDSDYTDEEDSQGDEDYFQEWQYHSHHR